MIEQLPDGVDRTFRFGSIRHRRIVIVAIVVVFADRLKHETIASGNEGDIIIEKTIVDLGLRDAPGQLSTHRRHRLIAEQRARRSRSR